MDRGWAGGLASLLAAVLGSGAAAQAAPVPVELVSRGGFPSDTAGGLNPSMSADGRWVAFESWAGNLVPGQVTVAAGSFNVFLHDRLTGATVLVSRAAGAVATAGNDSSFEPLVSGDGTVVVYTSFATNLVAGQVDTNQTTDVFLYDRVTGTTSLVSRTAASPVTTGDAFSSVGGVSADGQRVVFAGLAADLVPGQGDVPETFDVFLYDRVGGTTTLVSRAAGSTTTTANGGSVTPRISADGNAVLFESQATNLVAGQVDTNNVSDVFLFDTTTGENLLVSRTAASAVTAGNTISNFPAISADGSRVAFSSGASDLVAGMTKGNSVSDVFLFVRGGGTTLVSRTAAAANVSGNNESRSPRFSTDAGLVAFVSSATNLVSGQADANGDIDVFVYEVGADTTTLVSRVAGSSATTGDRLSREPVISGDGRFVAFVSQAGNLVSGQVDPAVHGDVFLHDRLEGTTVLLSGAGGSGTVTGNEQSTGPLSISADGGVVAFESSARNLISGVVDAIGRNVFAYERGPAVLGLVSRRDPDRPGVTSPGGATVVSGAVTHDGRYVVFLSADPSLVVGQVDTNQNFDVFFQDRLTGATTLVSRRPGTAATAGNRQSFEPVISADGRFVAFLSRATDLAVGVTDGNDQIDVFLYDREADALTPVSRAAGGLTTGNEGSEAVAISADGAVVAFLSEATDLVPGQVDAPGTRDLFLYDRLAGTTSLASRAFSSALTAGNGESGRPSLSADGRLVAFHSEATDLVSGLTDGNGRADVFLHDRETGTTTLASRTAASATIASDDDSHDPVLSADGRVVVFVSWSTNLVVGQVETGDRPQVFHHDRESGTTARAGRAAGSVATAANGPSESPVVSADGRWVAFLSRATDLVVGQVDTNDEADVFLYDHGTGTTVLASRAAVSPVTAGNGSRVSSLAMSGDGAVVAFASDATDLVAGQVDLNQGLDVFVYSRDAGTTALASRARGRGRGAARSGGLVVTGNGPSETPVLSADGRLLVFQSVASDLTGDDDVNGFFDVFAATPTCADRPCVAGGAR